ncbi:EF-hand domain-containing protein [Methylopila sp. M107]|uniref:EF-hand domain-containing protein n=1 Tax=Methylopila sp. M107 TaxID=1101190 RepID=UPI000367B4BD|nr:EF-hand domain-containing protein [Methylopila sp. M107]
MSRRVPALLVCALGALSAPAVAQDAAAPDKAASAVPGVFQRMIRPGLVREGFVGQIMGEFRSAAQGAAEVDRAMIDLTRRITTARARASAVSSLLVHDIDGDGVIEAKEASVAIGGMLGANATPEVASRMLDALLKNDLDGDGKLDAEEIRKAAAQQSALRGAPENGVERYFVFADASGALRAATLTTAAERAFDTVDSDGDTIVSQQENDAYRIAAGLPADRSPPRASPPPPPPSSPIKRGPDEEVYLVGVYEGFTGERGAPHGPRALVGLDRPGKKVTLLLCSYEGVRWSVATTPGTEIKDVMFFGAGGRSEVLVNDAPRQVGSLADNHPCPYEAKGANFRNAVSAVAKWTGFAKLDGFAGSYSASKTGYVIGAPTPLPELAPVYLKPAPLDGLPPIRFGATLKDVPGLYDLSGKLVEKGARGDGRRSVDVPARRERYEADHGGLKVTTGGDPATTKELPVSLDAPPLSWPCGIAYDPRRNRLVVVSLGGEGFAYEYLIETGKWRVLASMDNRDVSGLAYDAATDLLWTVDGATLIALDADGKRVRTVRPKALPGFFDTFDPGNGRPDLSLAAVESGKAVLLIKGSGKYRVYLVDLASGEATLTGAGD